MPYIKEELRRHIDGDIELLVDKIKRCYGDDQIDGCLNYIITSILIRSYLFTGSEPNVRYSKIQRLIGLLEAVKLELYRAVAQPYESKASFKNPIPDLERIIEHVLGKTE